MTNDTLNLALVVVGAPTAIYSAAKIWEIFKQRKRSLRANITIVEHLFPISAEESILSFKNSAEKHWLSEFSKLLKTKSYYKLHLNNVGHKSINKIRVTIPSSQFAEIEGERISIKEKGTIVIDELQPLDVVTLSVWSSEAITWDPTDRVRITHSEGLADTNYRLPAGQFARKVDNLVISGLVSVVLLGFFIAIGSFIISHSLNTIDKPSDNKSNGSNVVEPSTKAKGESTQTPSGIEPQEQPGSLP